MTKLPLALALAVAILATTRVHGDPLDTPHRGAESFLLTAAVPNLVRCGTAALELTFAGTGIDNRGGSFVVTTSACVVLATGHVSDLRATDRYLSGDSIEIRAADFDMVPDPATCAAVSTQPISYRVAGGTGALAGATGRGTFGFASIDPGCAARTEPVHVWFDGRLDVR